MYCLKSFLMYSKCIMYIQANKYFFLSNYHFIKDKYKTLINIENTMYLHKHELYIYDYYQKIMNILSYTIR